VLLGRELEWLEIQRLLAQIHCGRSGTLVLLGEPGIGKSALLEAAGARADGVRLLRARGIESEARIPFASLLELVRPILGHLGAIPEPQAAALEAALALRPRGAHERFAVGAATLSLLAAAAETEPLLLLVDDAHWLDLPSAEALLFALRRVSVDAIGALIAIREGEPSFLDGADLPVLRLAGLSMAEARQLIPDLPSAVLTGLHETTRGNPLAMLELSREPEALLLAGEKVPMPLPERIAESFSRRLAALPEQTRLALGFLAAGDTGDLASLGRPAQRLGVDLTALADGERAGLISLAGGRAGFRHPLVRAAAYASVPAEQLRDIHRALAATLPDRDLDRRAWHLAAAADGYDESASTALEQAAQRSRDRSAHATASAAFERAARLTGDGERRTRMLLDAGRAAWDAGLGGRATELLAEIRDETNHDAPIEADELAGHIAVQQAPAMRGHAILVAAADRADPERAVALLAEATAACFYAGEVRPMLQAARRTMECLPSNASDRARFLASAADGIAQTVGGDGGAGAVSIRSALELALRSSELMEDPQLLPWLIETTIFLRESDTGRELLSRSLKRARERAALGVLPVVLNLIGRDFATTDRWKEAEATYLEAAGLARETGQRSSLSASLAGLAWLYARRGLVAETRRRAEEAIDLSRTLGMRLFHLWGLAALGDLELGLGQVTEAIEYLEMRGRMLDHLGISDPDLSPAPELVEALVRLDRVEEAVPMVARLDAVARAKGQPWSLARAARSRALVASEALEMESEFEHALQQHARTADQFELGRTLLLYGEGLRRRRERRKARGQLREALDIFDRLEATPWAERARGELAASGETLRRRDPSSLDDLTPQELQIALLLAAGKTTRETGAALFISPKTVEYHLRHVYLKLGIHSRGELADAMRAGRGERAAEPSIR
jgi:DNA-binding CsgD family transcriptional regulator